MPNATRTYVAVAAASLVGLAACGTADILHGPDGRFELTRVVQLIGIIGFSWALISAVMLTFFHEKLFNLLTRNKKKLSDAIIEAHGDNLAGFGLGIIKALGAVPREFRGFSDTIVYPDRIALANEMAEIAKSNRDALLRLSTDVTEALLAARELGRIRPAIEQLTENVQKTNTLLEHQIRAQVATDTNVARLDERQIQSERQIEKLWDGIERRHPDTPEPREHPYRRESDRRQRR